MTLKYKILFIYHSKLCAIDRPSFSSHIRPTDPPWHCCLHTHKNKKMTATHSPSRITAAAARVTPQPVVAPTLEVWRRPGLEIYRRQPDGSLKKDED